MSILCKHYGKCGGCQIQHLSYDKQMEYKINEVLSLFGREPIDIIKSPKIWYYRNRMDYVVGPDYKVGLKEKGKWWAYVDLYECLLQSKESNDIRNKFREFIKEKNLEPWDTINHKGLVRYIVVREGKFTGERMVNVVTYKTTELNKIKEVLLDFYYEIEKYTTSFYLGINPDLFDTSYSKILFLLKGNKYLKEKLLDNIYYILPNTFFQSNSYTAEILLKLVKELADPRGNETIYDLYSGIGTFTIELAKYSKNVIGVEVSYDSHSLFYLNAKINEVSNVKLINKKVEDLNKIKADIIVLDPPRAGVHPRGIKIIGNSGAKKIIYVSCNPKTQARDIKQLRRFGYSFIEYYLIDQFPHTYHIETVAVLEKS